MSTEPLTLSVPAGTAARLAETARKHGETPQSVAATVFEVGLDMADAASSKATGGKSQKKLGAAIPNALRSSSSGDTGTVRMAAAAAADSNARPGAGEDVLQEFEGAKFAPSAYHEAVLGRLLGHPEETYTQAYEAVALLRAGRK